MRTLQFLDFHKHHLNNRTFDSCVWVNKEEGIFKVKWPKAPRNLEPSQLGIMFEWWKLKMGNTGIDPNEPSLIKNNYRSSQNSKIKDGKLIRRKDLEPKESIDGVWRVLQFPKSQENVLSPFNDIGEDISNMTDPGDLISRFDPGEMFADDFIDGEFSEVRHGNKKWEIVIKAYSKGTVIWDYTYDFAAEGLGSKKLLVYVDGNRTKYFDEKHLGRLIPESDYKSLNTAYPINPNTHKIFSQQFSHPRNPQKKMTRKDTFCPGFILEVDKCFNVYVTRLSLARLYYGHHGVQNNWQKLEMLKDGRRYLTSMESKDGVKQMIFSYRKFIHYSGVYQKWLEHGKPEISLIDSKVLMPVDDVPVVGRGCSSACDFYFEIDHKPATKVHQWIKQLENNIPASIFTSDPSDDPFFTEKFSKLNLRQQADQIVNNGQYLTNDGQRSSQSGLSNSQVEASINYNEAMNSQNNNDQYSARGGQYSTSNSGQYSIPNSGQYSIPNSGQYSTSNSGQYSTPNSGQYSTPNSGQYSTPNSGQYSGQCYDSSGQYYNETSRYGAGYHQNCTSCIQHGSGVCQCDAKINENEANATQYAMIVEPTFPNWVGDSDTPPITCRETFRQGNMMESCFNNANGICMLCNRIMCTCYSFSS
ncbi:hypothetical protein ACHWQZ_G010614 [Mnemiopsis leidyi]